MQIRNEQEYEQAVKRAQRMLDEWPNTNVHRRIEFDELTEALCQYEQTHYSVAYNEFKSRIPEMFR